MPELPEVETVRRDLLPLVVGRSVTRVARGLGDPRYVRLEEAVGRVWRDLRRRGKYLIADLGDRELVMHLGMSGRLGVGTAPLVGLGHVRVSFCLDDYQILYLNDPRRFGRLSVVRPGDYGAHPTLAQLGPEPLSDAFDFEPFARAVAGTARIKPLLLNQRIVAGLGNIYADEALFAARIHPGRSGLSQAEARGLFEAIRALLALAVEHRGTTFRDFRDGRGQPGGHQAFLRVYEREGEPCVRCGSAILKTSLGGRGTHFCPGCQPTCSPRAEAAGVRRLLAGEP